MDKPKLFVMTGIPASGKSTKARELSEEFNAIIHSSDELRIELEITDQTKENNAKIFQILHQRIKADLKLGNNVVFDATNINYKQRMGFLRELKGVDCEKICYFMATPYDDCIERNENRQNNVPNYVIKRMYRNFFIPQMFEGWDSIEIVWNYNPEDFSIVDLFYKRDTGLKFISQDNPHHELTIGEHCEKCSRNLLANSNNLRLAGFMHDIGKGFCKTFINSKGETTDVAHFYQHNLVSAYMSLFYLRIDWDYRRRDNELLEICKLVTWHMQPHFIENEKQRLKYETLLGKDTWDDVMILHEADKNARK